MSHTKSRSAGGKDRALRNGPHHIIIARGDKIRSFAVRPLSIVTGTILTIGVISGSLTIAAISFLKEDSQIAAAVQLTQTRQNYELQLADLQRQMDTLISRQLVEREVLNNQVAELLDRQGQLIERQQLLTGLANDALAAGIDVLPMLAPVPLANPLRNATGEPNGVGGPIDPTITGATEPGPQAAISHADALVTVEVTANWLAESQLDALALLASTISGRADELASLLQTLGYTPNASFAVGGPFEPAFGEEQLDLVTNELGELEQLQDFARSLPIGQPLAQLDLSSSFGRRLDPFLGESAMHTGADFRAPNGISVTATGPGIIVGAAVSGGYGKMVEIDHGGGLTTRYAHLSSILVDVGDVVQTGTIVGRVGSTGRSTGPHLHYEIRRDGTATNPMPHLLTGAEIAKLL